MKIRFVMTFVFCSGCMESGGDRVLKTEDLDRWANARMVHAYLKPAQHRSQVFISTEPNAPNDVHRILKSLTPMKQSDSPFGSPEYIFGFQSGRDPLEMEIRVCGEKVCFRILGRDYEGGNSTEFLRSIKPILNSMNSKDQ